MKKRSLLLSVVAAFGFTTASMAQVPNYVPSNGLVGWWPFNGNANDESGNGNNGTVNGATLTADRFGISNMAYSFDGINDYISTDRSGYTTFSISLWCKLPSPAMPVNPLVDGFDSYYDIYFTQSKLYYATFTSLNQYTNIDCIVTPSIGQWQHLVFVYSNNSISVYSNSSLAGTYNVQPLSGTAGNHNFGASLTGTDQYLNGCLDDIGIWNRALTAIEVNNLFNEGNVGIGDQIQNNSISIFPNPAQNVINVMADNKLLSEIYSIYDNTGKVVLTGKLNSQNTTIELGNLSGGIYMFSVGENMKQSFKVIKE